MLLFHGTTRRRAEQIVARGPDINYVEPGGRAVAENFSACLPFGPFDVTKTPEVYARGKARAALLEGRDEGGPAILMFEVPDEVLALAVDDDLPLDQGFVQFDRGPGLNALLVAWPHLPKRIIAFTDPRE